MEEITAPREALVIRLSRKLRCVGGQCFKLAVDEGIKEMAVVSNGQR